MPKLNTTLLRTAMLAAALGAVSIPALAQDAGSSTTEQTTTTTTTTEAPKMHHHGMPDVETRIKTLHDKLKITADQEADWTKVADTMRDNEESMHQLIDERHQDADTKSAIDDLQSYQKITQAHADGIAKMTAAFTAVYNEMSDDQKKNADEVFGRFEGHRGDKPMLKAKHKK